MVRLFATLVVLAACCLGAVGQTAQVIQLAPEDAALAKRLYADKAAIEKEIADLQARITKTYLSQPCDNGLNKSFDCPKYGGFWNSFEYSTDFKFVVPKAPSSLIINGSCNWSGAIFTSGCCPTWSTTPTVLTGPPIMGTITDTNQHYITNVGSELR